MPYWLSIILEGFPRMALLTIQPAGSTIRTPSYRYLHSHLRPIGMCSASSGLVLAGEKPPLTILVLINWSPGHGYRVGCKNLY